MQLPHCHLQTRSTKLRPQHQGILVQSFPYDLENKDDERQWHSAFSNLFETSQIQL